ncbi:hypothetical protein RDWZM_005474 [Blomia tropicalis]|uniref:Uncharacterized protein n=1 Tax=Blomia tropicalis TaxID=40697 RepID=A0A9Q0M8I4_BLOTA|nr:hypothetical protein RDWZM_005474 [Blomia tropicalis]
MKSIIFLLVVAIGIASVHSNNDEVGTDQLFLRILKLVLPAIQKDILHSENALRAIDADFTKKQTPEGILFDAVAKVDKLDCKVEAPTCKAIKHYTCNLRILGKPGKLSRENLVIQKAECQQF